MKANNVDKKVWISPKLIIHGNVEQLTREGTIPQKEYGDGDGVLTDAQNIKWAS